MRCSYRPGYAMTRQLRRSALLSGTLTVSLTLVGCSGTSPAPDSKPQAQSESKSSLSVDTKAKPLQLAESAALKAPKPKPRIFSLKGIVPGMTLVELRTALKKELKDPELELKQTVSEPHRSEYDLYDSLHPEPSFRTTTFANVYCRPVFRFVKAPDGKLRLYTMQTMFYSEDWDQMREALVAKFGQPTSISSESVQNRMGAQFENDSALWESDASSLLIQKYCGDVDSSVLVLNHNQFRKLAEQQKSENRDVKDL